MRKPQPLIARIAVRATVFATIAIVYQLVASVIFDSQPMWNTARVVVLAVGGALVAVWEDRRERRNAREGQATEAQ